MTDGGTLLPSGMIPSCTVYEAFCHCGVPKA